MKTALIFGITGQDGSYLSEFLLSKKYKVWGMVRNLHTHDLRNLRQISDCLNLIDGNITNSNSINQAIYLSNPDEIYNLAGHTDVASSWENPIHVYQSVAVPPTIILEYILKIKKNIKFYQSSTSEMFGNVNSFPQNETTSFYPRNPYGVAKLFAHWTTLNYRKKFGIFAVSGILYNHESPRRTEKFVTKKIIVSAIRIKFGLQKKMFLGNIDAQRDWGYAPDYVDAIWRMMQSDSPDDFVIGTGNLNSVREFCKKTFEYLNLDYKKFVEFDENLKRSLDDSTLVADTSKALTNLSWKPNTNLDQLIRIMIDHEMREFEGQN